MREYKVVSISKDPDEATAALNEWAAKGWEVVHIVPSEHVALLRREANKREAL